MCAMAQSTPEHQEAPTDFAESPKGEVRRMEDLRLARAWVVAMFQKRSFLEQTPHLCLSRGVRFVHDQEGSIGIARFKHSSLSETEMVAACEDCARLSIAD